MANIEATDQNIAMDVLALAALLHSAVPAGANGGTVTAALAVLIGAGINYAPENIRDDLLSDTLETIKDVVATKCVVFKGA